MRRLWPVLALGGVACLNAGTPLYGKLDETPPRVLATDPLFDGGVPTLLPGRILTVTFSEPMNLDSLRAGISVRNRDRREQPLTLRVDPDQVFPVTAADPDLPQVVQISSAEPGGFPTGPYQLILRTLLIDQQGNPLFDGDPTVDAGAVFRDIDFIGNFFVQF